MNKSLLIQNGIAGGIAGTVADGLFKDEDNHSYAKSAFMGTLAGVGATALHQKWPVTKSGAQAPADHVPPTAPVQQPTTATAQTEPVAKPAPAEQPKVAEPIASKQESPVVAQAQPAKPIKPEEPAKPIQTPVAPAESAKQPTAASEPVQQPAAAPSVEKQTERERIIEREPEARAQVEPKPAEQPKAVQPVQTEPVKPIQITPEKQPEPATQPVQQRRQKPVRPTPKVVRNEPKPEEFVGPHDQSKLTKTINSVKQSASNVGNGILEGAKNIVATASKLKIPPIELNISGAGKQIAQAGRSIASGLARSAQALSIAAIASMDMGGGHAVVQHAYETATHAVQVQASMATSTMTKAVKDVGEAVSNYHPGQGIENAIKDMQAVPKAAQATVAVPKAIDSYKNDNYTLPMFQKILDDSPRLQTKFQTAILASAKDMIGKPFKPDLQYRCADSVSTALDNAIKNSHTKPAQYSHTLLAAQFKNMGFQEIPYDKLKPGDILGFTNTWRKSANNKDFTHVGIYLGNNKFGHRASLRVQLPDKSWTGGDFREDTLSEWLSKRADKKTTATVYRVNQVMHAK